MSHNSNRNMGYILKISFGTWHPALDFNRTFASIGFININLHLFIVIWTCPFERALSNINVNRDKNWKKQKNWLIMETFNNFDLITRSPSNNTILKWNIQSYTKVLKIEFSKNFSRFFAEQRGVFWCKAAWVESKLSKARTTSLTHVLS